MTSGDSALTGSSGLIFSPQSSRWTEIFCGMLVHPRATIQMLASEDGGSRNQALYGTLILVLIAFTISGATESTSGSPLPGLEILTVSAFNGIVFWLAIASILYIVSGWLARRDLSYRSSLICVGWAFLPLILVAPFSCFNFLGPIQHLLALLPVGWSTLLMLFVFSRCLDVSASKLFAALMFITPLLFFAYLFWFSTVLLLLLQLFV